MMYMSNILEDDGIPANTGVAIEYKIPQTSKRIDFILTGINENQGSTAVIIELKQWSDVKLTDKDGIVRTYLGGGVREVNHPSYQAWAFFNGARLDIVINDRFSQPVTPREWFLVPLFVIDEVVEKIKDGDIGDYSYDVNSVSLVPVKGN